MAIEEKQTELSWDEAVARFLQDNPGYFEQNPQLLRHLDIPHAESGRAVSLIERQVMALRRENEGLQKQLGQWVENATENDALTGQIHQFIIELLNVNNEDDLIKVVAEDLKSRFDLDASVLKLFGRAAGDANKEVYVANNIPVMRQLCDQVHEGRSVSGVQLSSDECKMLFAQDEAPEGSLALIPILYGQLYGVLVIGSADPLRFKRDLATTYLDRIGELIAVALKRLSTNQSGQSGQTGK